MFTKYRKFIFLSLLALFLFLPLVSHAATDTRCWKRTDCEKEDDTGMSGVFYSSSETETACGKSKDASGVEIGFCSPAGSSKTEIGFSGTHTFSSIGEFIKWVYRYGIQVASILAVIMIIVAGVQWATSGGNQEAIGSARKKIGGALMGLFLAALSYFVLNQVNPYLVNLRMPNIWKINKLGIAPPICNQITDGRKISATPSGSYDLDPATASCGTEYYVENSGDLPCKGNYCATGACLPVKWDGNNMLAQSTCDNSADVLIRYRVTGAFRTAAQLLVDNSYWVAKAIPMENIPVSDDANGWIDRTDIYVLYVCNNGAGEVRISERKKNNNFAKWAVQEIPGKEWKDVYFYYNLGLINKDLSNCPSTHNKSIDGYMIEHQIDILGDSSEAVFYVTIDKSGKKVIFGKWDRVWKSFNASYFKDDTKGYFEADFTDQILGELTT